MNNPNANDVIGRVRRPASAESPRSDLSIRRHRRPDHHDYLHQPELRDPRFLLEFVDSKRAQTSLKGSIVDDAGGYGSVGEELEHVPHEEINLLIDWVSL